MLNTNVDIHDVVETLQESGFLVEGEFGIELTEDGKSVRSTVRFKPKEGLIQKISRIFSVNVDLSLSDLFKT